MSQQPLSESYSLVSSGSSLEADPLFTVQEVSAYLKLQPSTIRAMARTGELPAIKMNRVWRFQKSRIDQFIKSHTSIG